MKKILLTLTAVLLTIVSFSQIQSNCNVPSILYTEYDEVVTDLAIRRMYQVNSQDTVYITVPQSQKDTIFKGLAAIFNAPTLVGWDSVFNKFCIKQNFYNMYYNRKATVTLDTNYAWTHNWLNEDLITGYAELDSFISNNEFIYVNKVTYSSNKITLQPDISKYMNYKAFCDSLINFDGIINAYSSNIVYLDGNIITYNKINDTKFYNFLIKYGNDCQMGCVNSHIWKYKVNQNCSVDFLEIEEIIGDSEPFPTPTNCNISTKITESESKNFNIYPNPTTNMLNIDLSNLSNDKSNDILIYDVYGQVVKQSEINNSKFDINIENLQKGIYFIKIGSLTKKFIKK